MLLMYCAISEVLAFIDIALSRADVTSAYFLTFFVTAESMLLNLPTYNNPKGWFIKLLMIYYRICEMQRTCDFSCSSGTTHSGIKLKAFDKLFWIVFISEYSDDKTVDANSSDDSSELRGRGSIFSNMKEEIWSNDEILTDRPIGANTRT